MQLLIQGQIPGQLVAPIGDLHNGAGFGAALLRIDLDHPDLIGTGVQQIPYRWIFGNNPQNRPPSTGTDRNRVGIAAEASTASAVISPRRLSKALNTPDITSTAPSTSNGRSGTAESVPDPLRRSKSTHRSSNDRS